MIIRPSCFPVRAALRAAAGLTFAGLLAPLAFGEAAAEPPTSWIDPGTGHRVVRITREPASASLYFNDNGYTPDGKEMIYTTGDGSIGVVTLANFATRIVVPGPVRAISVGHKTPTVYYLKDGPDPLHGELWGANLDSGEPPRKLADLPRRGKIFTINADETLAAGTFIEGEGQDYGGPGTVQAHVLDQPANKGQMMVDRLAARLPMWIYTVDLKTGQAHNLLFGRDWLNHLQFSPADPGLLMYCHEGLWWLVNRIWTIRTDGTHNQLAHQRTMEMEIAGHEWWGYDGQTIWYQLHYPPVMQTSFVASYNVGTGERIWYRYAPDGASIHHNISPDGKLFCGDGDKGNPGIFLLRPTLATNHQTLGEHLIKGGALKSEKLANLPNHDYKLEPNPIFTPDQKWIMFRSNMFNGVTYGFAVEVAKADAAH